MKKIKVIGRENIKNPRTGSSHDDDGLRALNGIHESEIKECGENICEVANKLIEQLKDNYPQLEDGEFEIVEID